MPGSSCDQMAVPKVCMVSGRMRWPVAVAVLAHAMLATSCGENDAARVLSTIVATREACVSQAKWGPWENRVIENVHGQRSSVMLCECGDAYITPDGECLPQTVTLLDLAVRPDAGSYEQEVQDWWESDAYIAVSASLREVYRALPERSKASVQIGGEVAAEIVRLECARAMISAMDLWRPWENIGLQLDLILQFAARACPGSSVVSEVAEAREAVRATIAAEALWRTGSVAGGVFENRLRALTRVGFAEHFVKFHGRADVMASDMMRDYSWRSSDVRTLQAFWDSCVLTRWVEPVDKNRVRCVRIGEVAKHIAASVMGKERVDSFQEVLDWAARR